MLITVSASANSQLFVKNDDTILSRTPRSPSSNPEQDTTITGKVYRFRAAPEHNESESNTSGVAGNHPISLLSGNDATSPSVIKNGITENTQVAEENFTSENKVTFKEPPTFGITVFPAGCVTAGVPTKRASLLQHLSGDNYFEDLPSTSAVSRPLMISGGVPVQGTRHRIRARISSAPADDASLYAKPTYSGSANVVQCCRRECEEELLHEEFADGILKAEEIAKFRDNVWHPKGVSVPHPSSVSLPYHTAWDIGKKGCVGMKLRNTWESSVNPNRLRFFIMDGTDPIAFLSIYGENNLQNLTGPNVKKRVVWAFDVRDAVWDYPACRLTIRRSDKNGKRMVIDKLPQLFIDAMIVCLREMEVVFEVNRLQKLRLEERRFQETRAMQKRYESRLSVARLSESQRPSFCYSDTAFDRRPGEATKKYAFAPKMTETIAQEDLCSSLGIGATRRSAKALVSPSPLVLAKVVESRRKANTRSGITDDNYAKPDASPDSARPRRLRLTFKNYRRRRLPSSEQTNSGNNAPGVPMLEGRPIQGGLTLGARAAHREPH